MPLIPMADNLVMSALTQSTSPLPALGRAMGRSARLLSSAQRGEDGARRRLRELRATSLEFNP